MYCIKLYALADASADCARAQTSAAAKIPLLHPLDQIVPRRRNHRHDNDGGRAGAGFRANCRRRATLLGPSCRGHSPCRHGGLFRPSWTRQAASQSSSSMLWSRFPGCGGSMRACRAAARPHDQSRSQAPRHIRKSRFTVVCCSEIHFSPHMLKREPPSITDS